MMKRDLHTACLVTLKSSLPLSAKALTLCSLILLRLVMHLWGAKKLIKACKTFPFHEQIACTVYDDWVMPEGMITLPKVFSDLYQVEKVFTIKWVIPVVAPAVFLNLSLYLLKIVPFKDSANRKFETLLNSLFAIAVSNQLALLFQHIKLQLTGLGQ